MLFSLKQSQLKRAVGFNSRLIWTKSSLKTVLTMSNTEVTIKGRIWNNTRRRTKKRNRKLGHGEDGANNLIEAKIAEEGKEWEEERATIKSIKKLTTTSMASNQNRLPMSINTKWAEGAIITKVIEELEVASKGVVVVEAIISNTVGRRSNFKENSDLEVVVVATRMPFVEEAHLCNRIFLCGHNNGISLHRSQTISRTIESVK